MELTNWFPLIVMVASSSTATAASDCGKLTNTSMSSGTITSPLDTTNKTSCQWNIQLPLHYTSLQIRFHDLKLRNCTNCSCDYIEVWNSSTKNPKDWVGKYCGDLKEIHAKGNTFLVEYGSSVWSGMTSNHTFLSYRGLKEPVTTPDPSTGSSSLAVKAIGITFSVLVFVGALAWRMYVFRHTTRRERRVRRRRQPSQIQQQPADQPHLPKLPNYFDTDNHVILPPYLGFAPDEGKAVDDSESPPSYDDPPPYSITEAAETAGLETTVQKVTAENNARFDDYQ